MSDTTFDAKITQLGDSLAGLTLKEAVDLGKYMKEKYGIEAAAGGAVVMAAAGGAAAPKAEEKTSFDVVLKAVDATKKIAVIKVVREVTGLGLAEAKAFVDAPGKAVKTGLDKAEAEKLQKSLTEAGATIELA
ncbi:MAG: 50S ribosomal protein L7/L12 [Phycisphaeraceae bacterium]|nr:MAG: 50S ribosomal protein L7/L12 [Phycisphaeraceae bacterium]